MNTHRLATLTSCSLLLVAASEARAEGFDAAARDYADTMLRHGMDRYGETHSPIFLTMLSREAEPRRVHEGNIGAPGKKLPGWEGRYYNRDWGGMNLGNHIQFHVLLGELSEATGDPKYLEASKEELRFVFQNTQSPETGFIVWGEHLSWDVAGEHPFSGRKPAGQPHDDTHEMNDRMPPELWDRVYGVAPQEAFRFALGLWDHQIFDQSTGMFSRHARYTAHKPDRYAANFPRVGGWMMLAWSEAYRRSDDSSLRETMIRAITTLTKLYEGSRSSITGALSAGIKTPGDDEPRRDYTRVYWLENNLILACELELAAPGLPAELAERLRALQAGIDEVALTKLEHNLDGHVAGMPAGFLHRARPDQPLMENGTMQPGDGRVSRFDGPRCYTSDWAHGYGSPLTSSTASLMLERYAATRDSRYLALARQAADRYLTIEPPADNTAPQAVADAISFMLAMHEATGEAKYLDRAVHFGEEARSMFLEGSPLPKATASHGHYEAITGGDDLMLALWELSQAATRTAHRGG